jgi:hypothetical protein
MQGGYLEKGRYIEMICSHLHPGIAWVSPAVTSWLDEGFTIDDVVDPCSAGSFDCIPRGTRGAQFPFSSSCWARWSIRFAVSPLTTAKGGLQRNH